ncbi:MAG: YihY/virulence factor BrkB family protein [Gemmatimonadetes bacterium]|nr:YihY/virulence factor BrkB family protein [Gemmatimonadota bacterium]
MEATAGLRWRFLWHDVRNFVRRVYQGAAESNVPFLASGLTFDALLAAIPLALLVLSLVGYLLNAGADAAQVELRDYLQRWLPTRARGGTDPFEPVIRLAEGVTQSRGTLGVLGLPLFVWFSTRLFGSLRAVLCEVFDTEETRSWLRGKLQDVALVLVTGLLFVANAAASEGLAVLGERNPAIGFLEFVIVQLLAYVFVLLLFLVVFRYAPARRIRWDSALVAAVTCSLGFEIAKQVLGLYFRTMVRADQLVSDATLGALLLFVGWVYYMTFVFLLGGEIAQVYELRRRQAAQRAILSG